MAGAAPRGSACDGALASALLRHAGMPSSPRDDAPTADELSHETLQDLQAELGEVEWFGRRTLGRRRERLASRPRWTVPATERLIWSNLLAWRE